MLCPGIKRTAQRDNTGRRLIHVRQQRPWLLQGTGRHETQGICNQILNHRWLFGQRGLLSREPAWRSMGASYRVRQHEEWIHNRCLAESAWVHPRRRCGDNPSAQKRSCAEPDRLGRLQRMDLWGGKRRRVHIGHQGKPHRHRHRGSWRTGISRRIFLQKSRRHTGNAYGRTRHIFRTSRRDDIRLGTSRNDPHIRGRDQRRHHQYARQHESGERLRRLQPCRIPDFRQTRHKRHSNIGRWCQARERGAGRRPRRRSRAWQRSQQVLGVRNKERTCSLRNRRQPDCVCNRERQRSPGQPQRLLYGNSRGRRLHWSGIAQKPRWRRPFVQLQRRCRHHLASGHVWGLSCGTLQPDDC